MRYLIIALAVVSSLCAESQRERDQAVQIQVLQQKLDAAAAALATSGAAASKRTAEAVSSKAKNAALTEDKRSLTATVDQQALARSDDASAVRESIDAGAVTTKITNTLVEVLTGRFDHWGHVLFITVLACTLSILVILLLGFVVSARRRRRVVDGHV